MQQYYLKKEIDEMEEVRNDYEEELGKFLDFVHKHYVIDSDGDGDTYYYKYDQKKFEELAERARIQGISMGMIGSYYAMSGTSRHGYENGMWNTLEDLEYQLEIFEDQTKKYGRNVFT